MFVLLRREKRRFSKPKLMYKLPDEVAREDYNFKPSPPPVRNNPAFSSDRPPVRNTPAFSSDRSSHASHTSLATSHGTSHASQMTHATRTTRPIPNGGASTIASRRGSLQTLGTFELMDSQMSK
ncbi:hypothetical protein LTR37_020328 [Vermiconidia calcicola]|uniref:Uncharacterized protein n=1 Tax=Vermiconidia calcicola TaxID=1690605 RepID=A0ACC3MDI0_9PEZI|nr:hypothetical protein LTR37_020328 [Vermiconidia calcicola]